MQFSTFGTKFSQHSGITQLMDDLNDGLQNPDAIMLGGGNPAAIPEMIEHFTHLSQRMVEDGSLVSALTNYDGPQGKSSFISAYQATQRYLWLADQREKYHADQWQSVCLLLSV